uniref:Metallo-beta-lactamase domain-containing protein n=1 Tax=Plectus sambesii TaxID=2011161 RepID=A0A914VXD9_9BILA
MGRGGGDGARPPSKEVGRDGATSTVNAHVNEEDGAAKKPPLSAYEKWAQSYRCCCGCIHLKLACALIGVIDFVLLSIPLGKGIQLYLTIKSNPVAAGWFVASVMIYLLHFFCVLAKWYGIWRQRSLWILPKIVLKVFTVLLCVSVSAFFGYLVWNRSRMIINLVTRETSLSYRDARTAIKYGGSFLVAACCAFTCVQIWFLIVIYDCYRYVRDQELTAALQKLIAADQLVADDDASPRFPPRNTSVRKCPPAPTNDRHCVEDGLAKESVTLEDIDMVVITHGHPGHMGNMNFFGQKTVLFHSMQYVGRSVSPTELRDRPYRKLSTNVELWKTPGHTQQDLSLLVHNVPGYGSMAIVGDLIPSEEMIEHYKSNMPPQEGVWDVATQRQNANLMVCMSDWIVPGHGQPFRVKTEYRQKAGCTRLLAQMRLKAQ